ARRRATGVHRIGAGDPGRGHGHRDPGGRAAVRLRAVPPGARGPRRDRSRPRHRARGRPGARRPCDGRVARRKRESLHSASAARMRVARLAVVSALLAGCATGPFAVPSAQMLAKADRLAADGDYRSAIAAYDAYLAAYSDSSNAPRARASRDVLTTREEIGRLQQELGRMREELAKREGDLTRVRQEAERLRADLERLKQIDLQLETRK